MATKFTLLSPELQNLTNMLQFNVLNTPLLAGYENTNTNPVLLLTPLAGIK